MSESTDKQASQSIGERLRAARELAGVSPAVAAERLHLDPNVIDALEADRFEALGAPVYVRGHLRRYAEFLGLSPDALLAEYQAGRAKSAAPDLTQIPQADRPSDPRKLLGPSLAAAVAVLLGIAVWWVAQRAGNEEAKPTVVATPQPLPPVAVPVETAPAAPSETSVVTVPNTESAAVADAPASATTVPATTTAATTTATASPTAPTENASARPPRANRDVTVQLRFPTDSWVEVYDARGRKLFYDVATGGSSQTVSGRGPLRVVLGMATGVSVAVDGRDAAIPQGAIRGEEARFVVTESGSLVRSR
jgi:cytoskeleton protein RodZ